MKKTWIAWALWLVVVFGVTNCFGPNLDHVMTPQDQGIMSDDQLMGRLSTFERFRYHFRDDDDSTRYFAYANAILGRPYQKYYIRDLAGWRRDELRVTAADYGIVAPARPLVPWRDFFVEYPPAMLPIIMLPALATTDFEIYHRLFCLEMDVLLTLALAFAVALTRRLRPGEESATIYLTTLAVWSLGVIALRRYDPALSLLVCAALYALSRSRMAASGAALGAAILIKITPIMLAPLALMAPLARGDRRGALIGAASALAALAAALLPWLYFFGPGLTEIFTYHGERTIQAESLYAGLLFAAQIFDPNIVALHFDHGSLNVVSPYGPALLRLATWAPPLAIGAILAASWPALRRARDDDRALISVMIRACCAVFAAFIALNKVASPQYYVWLLPLGVLASMESGRIARNLFLTALVMAQVGNMLTDPHGVSALGGFATLLRCGVTLAWAATLVAPFARRAEAGAAILGAPAE